MDNILKKLTRLLVMSWKNWKSLILIASYQDVVRSKQLARQVTKLRTNKQTNKRKNSTVTVKFNFQLNHR